MPSFAITDFIDSCRRFSDGSLVPEDVTVLRSVSERQMPDRYRIPFPEPVVSPVTQDRKEDSRHLRALWHELAQHLRDLRYLSETEFVFYHKHKKHILTDPLLQDPVVAAVRLYLLEEREWPDLLEILTRGDSIDRLQLQAHLSSIVDRIGLHTCWDGAGIIPDKYSLGERSVFSRALSYRLRTVSSSQFDLGPLPDYYGGENLDVLNTLFSEGFNVRGTAGERGMPRGFWTKLLNIDTLLTSYINNTEKRKNNPPLRYQLEPPEGDTVVLLEKLTGRELRTGRTGQVSDKFYHIRTVNRITRGARRRNHRPDDGLDIRLLQIKLWQAGYYTGTIDEEWGNLSHVALKTFLMDEAGFIAEAINPAPTDPAKFEKFLQRKQPQTARKVRSLLVKVSDDDEVYAADFIGIIRVFTDKIAGREREMINNATLNVEEDLLRELPASAGISNEKFDSHILGETGIEALFPDNTQHTERRVSFFRRVGGFIVGGLGKIVDWLKKGIREIGKALGKLLGPVFTFIKKMMRPIRSAIDRFFSGFKYLASFVFGKPLLTEVAPATPTAAARVFGTRFQLDFDAFNYIPANFKPGEPAQHAGHINRMRRDMAYFIDGVVWIIKAIGKLSSPGGWVWLGWQIVRAIAQPIFA
jgi:hypothetical protein